MLLGCGLRICIPSKLTCDGPEAGPLTTISKAFSVMNSSVQACLHSVVGSYSAGKKISSFEAEIESEWSLQHGVVFTSLVALSTCSFHWGH